MARAEPRESVGNLEILIRQPGAARCVRQSLCSSCSSCTAEKYGDGWCANVSLPRARGGTTQLSHRRIPVITVVKISLPMDFILPVFFGHLLSVRTSVLREDLI